MAIYSDTLDNLVEKTCKLVLHDWAEGTASGDATGSSTLDDDTNRNEEDDFWNELPYAEVYIRTTTDSGAPIGETRKISDFANSGGQVTVSDAFSANITTLDTYSIHTDFKRDSVVEAINMAIDMVAEKALVWKVDATSTTTVADTYKYNVPSGFMYINKITMADASGNFPGDPIPPDQWSIMHGATQEIEFALFPTQGQFQDHYYSELWAETDMVASRSLRIEGLAIPDVLSADTDTCPISPAYIMYQAGAILHGGRIEQPEGNYDAHRTQAEFCQGRADVERARIVPIQLPPNSKRVFEK